VDNIDNADLQNSSIKIKSEPILIEISPSHSTKSFGRKNNNMTTEEEKLSDCRKKQNIDQINENKIKIKIESYSMEVTPTDQVVATSTNLNNIEIEPQENPRKRNLT
ncbi:9764_t:CDS:1, partial [Dentiscutata erythropus]